MPAFKDLTGKRFGKWVVIKWKRKQYAEQFWECVCDCGTVREIIGGTLKKGLSLSCGCAGKDWCRRHGKEGTPVYNTWSAIKQRCCNPLSNLYTNYGGRGIKICDRWLDFVNFYEDMGDKPKGQSIDRIDPNGDYEPSNCRWATAKTQARNKRKTIYLDYKGETKPMAEWAEIMGIKRKVLENRIRSGWDIAKALETPLRSKK